MERVLKKNSKRFWFVMLVLAMCIGLAFSLKLILNPKAEEPATGTYGDFTYKVENGEVLITKYTGKDNAEVSIPATINGLPVTEIGDNAFSGAGNRLEIVDFGERSNLKRIGKRAFYCCGLKNLNLPDSVTYIGERAFQSAGIFTLRLSKNLECIEKEAFYNTNIRRIYIPDFTKDIQIGNYIWYHEVDPRYGLTIGYSTVAIFEDGIEAIPDNMFEGLLSLSWAEIPDSVTTIGNEAFNRCTKNGGTVVIPNSVTSIGENAFASGDWGATVSSRPKIRCYEGSYAETYAIENGFSYETWDGATRFTYPSTFEHDEGESKNVEANCYYSDQYFSDGKNNKGSYTYKPSLATMSMALAFSAFGRQEGNYSSSYQNATKLMENVGMIGTTAYSCNTRPGTDTIGVICGTKYIYVDGKWQTLIVCAIRGGGYGAEWASNFTVGSSGQHEGFNLAKIKVKQYLENYINSVAPLYSYSFADPKPAEPIKIWITGYSRAAAVANLLAADIDSHNVDFGTRVSYDAKDVYTYTFETPAGALKEETKDDQFDNIFNIINPADPVPYLAPSQLGFGRYGVDYYTPAAGVYKNYMGPKARMMDIYDSLPYANNESKKYDDVDNFTRKRLYLILPKKNEEEQNWEANFVVKDDILNLRQTQTAFLTDLSTDVANDIIGSRDQFVVNYEREVRAACSVIFSKLTDAQKDAFKDTLMEEVKANWLKVAGPVILIGPTTFWDDYNAGAIPATVALKKNLMAEVGNWVQAAAAEVQTSFSGSDKDSVVKALTRLLVNFVAENPQKTTSLIGNADGIKAGHYPELCFSWVASMDKNYNPNAEVTLHKNRWRKLRINCDVNVSVYDSNHNLVAQIKNEEPVVLNNTYDYGIDIDGQKYVILPADEDYTIDIQAYNDTVVNYGISEYSAAAGEFTRDINYFNVRLKKDATLTAEASSYPQEEIETDDLEASHATYTLETAEGKELPATSDLKDAESIEASYRVDGKSSNEEYGIVLGSGTRKYGQYAELEAYPREGYEFFGWYQDGKLVSRDNPYRFRVESDAEIIGQFEDEKNIVTMKEIDGKWYAVRGDEVVSDFTGFLKYDGKLWYAENGKIEFNKTGVFKDPQTGEEYYCLENEVKKNYTGPAPYNGKIWYVEDGKVVTLYQGLYKQNANNWYVMKDGQRDSSYQGAISDNGVLYWVKDGKVNFNENRILWTGKEWLKFTKGKEDRSFQTIGYNDAGFWKCKNGVVDFGYNGISYNEAGFWKCKNGKVDFGYNGIGYNEAGWWKCKGGKVDFGYNGIGYNEAGWWKCSGGKVDFNFTGVGYNDAGWWYCNHGKVDFKYNGLGSNTAGIWVIKGGKVDFNYTGRYRFNNSVFTVRGGKVVS